MSVIEAPAPARTEVTTRDVLHRAADLLEEFGWCQGFLGSKATGRMCAFGAMVESADDLRISTDLLRQAVGRVTPFDEEGLGGHLTTWNDHPRRTKAEVVARLRAAAENA